MNTYPYECAGQIALLEEDLARLDRDLNRVPQHVVDWSAYMARQDRLRRDRMRLEADLRAAKARLRRAA